MPDAVGVPLMVIVLLAKLAVTPEGNPVGEPMPVAPVVVCVMGVKVVLMHSVGVLDAALTVLFGVTVITTTEVAAIQGPAPSGSLVVKVKVTVPLVMLGV